MVQIYYEKELGQFEAKLKNTNYANEEEEYRAKMIPQQIDETKAALKDTEDRLSNGKYTFSSFYFRLNNRPISIKRKYIYVRKK